jgi:hypothetical protein
MHGSTRKSNSLFAGLAKHHFFKNQYFELVHKSSLATPKWEVGSQKWEVRSGKLEVGSGKLEVGSWKSEVGS